MKVEVGGGCLDYDLSSSQICIPTSPYFHTVLGDFGQNVLSTKGHLVENHI